MRKRHKRNSLYFIVIICFVLFCLAWFCVSHFLGRVGTQIKERENRKTENKMKGNYTVKVYNGPATTLALGRRQKFCVVRSV